MTWDDRLSASAGEQRDEQGGNSAGVRLREASAQQEESYRNALGASGLLAARVDTDLRYVWICNPHPSFHPGTVIGKRDDELADNDAIRALTQLKQRVLDSGTTGTAWITFPTGDPPSTYRVVGEPLFDEHGRTTGVITISVDTTRLALLEHVARTDALTELANRRGTAERLEEGLQRLQRYGDPCGVLLLDVDHFKAINDTFGHKAGDEVLRELARALRRHTRSIDVVGRWGGEEFLLILPDLDWDAGLAAARRLRQHMEEATFAGHSRLTVSMGYTTAAAHDTIDSLLMRVDDALYDAKAAGRNRVSAVRPPAEGTNQGTTQRMSAPHQGDD